MMSHLDIAVNQIGYGQGQGLAKGYIRFFAHVEHGSSELGFSLRDSKKARNLVVCYLQSLPVTEATIMVDLHTTNPDEPDESLEYTSVKEAVVKLRSKPILNG